MAGSLVIGGSGFLGSAIALEIASVGETVVTLDVRPPSSDVGRHILASINDPNWDPELLAEFDTVFLFSGLLGTSKLFEDPLHAVDVNVKGPLRVFDSLKNKAAKPRFIIPSQDYTWNNLYVMTSQALEKIALSYSDYFGFQVHIVQIANAYGPGQALRPVQKLVPHLITQALTQQPIEIFGSGTQIVKLCYSMDVARALVELSREKTAERQLFFDYNVDIAVLSLARRIIELTQSGSEIIFRKPRVGEGGLQTGWYSSGVSEVTNISQTELNAGLQATIDYYRGTVPP